MKRIDRNKSMRQPTDNFLRNEIKNMKDSVIIVSGGMDSITLLYEWKERIALGISFDYGMPRKYRWHKCTAID